MSAASPLQRGTDIEPDPEHWPREVPRPSAAAPTPVLAASESEPDPEGGERSIRDLESSGPSLARAPSSCLQEELTLPPDDTTTLPPTPRNRAEADFVFGEENPVPGTPQWTPETCVTLGAGHTGDRHPALPQASQSAPREVGSLAGDNSCGASACDLSDRPWPDSSPGALVGKRVTVVRTGRQDLNGRAGLALSFDERGARYHVQLERWDETVAVKPANLEEAMFQQSCEEVEFLQQQVNQLKIERDELRKALSEETTTTKWYHDRLATCRVQLRRLTAQQQPGEEDVMPPPPLAPPPVFTPPRIMQRLPRHGGG